MRSRKEERRSKWIIQESVSPLREKCRWMEGGFKEFGITAALRHAAHPPRSSLSVSLQPQRQTVTPMPPSPKPTLQQRAQSQRETPKPAPRLQSACMRMQPSAPGQHRAPLLYSVLQSLQRGAPLLKIYPFNSPQNSTSLHLLLVLLWLQSVGVLFQLYSIFLSHF